MYKNSGKIIKIVANVFFFIGIGVSVIMAFIFLIAAADSYYEQDMFITFAILTFFLGPVVSYLGNLVLYGFGELIDNTKENGSALKNMTCKLVAIQDSLNKDKKGSKED